MDFLAPVVGPYNDASDPGTSFYAIIGSDQQYQVYINLVAPLIHRYHLLHMS